VISKRN